MSKLSNLTKEELLALAEKQEAELASKKYGLVWDAEREPEQVVLDCEHHLPVLKRVKGKEIKTALDQGDNILIEGDNYHALTTLNYTHQGKIDVIYIDPPYNTGNKDFKYNDKFVDKEDGFRHSKWLNFMEKRLRLAKDLLTEKGMIFISIDDNEFAQLKLLCDKIFGEDNFINCISVKTKSSAGASGGGEDKKLKKHVEYLLFYSKNRSYFSYNNIFIGRDLEEIILEKEDSGKQFEYRHVLVSEGKKELFDIIKDGSGQDIKIFKHAKYEIKSISSLIKNDKINREEAYSKYFEKIFRGQPAQSSIRTKVNEATNNEKGLFSIEYIPRSGKRKNQIAQNYYFKCDLVNWLSDTSQKSKNGKIIKYEKAGTLWADLSWNGLSSEGGVSFENGKKPIAFLKRILQLYPIENPIVLDFFAGSGSMGHAVLDLNIEDGQGRTFILSTNNEGNICQEKTYPRINNVIKGHGKKQGLGGNLQYFKTDLIKKTGNKDQMRINLTQKCTDILCVKENIFNLETEHDDYKIFSSNQKNQFLCIYYNFYDESFDEFLKQVKKLKGHKKIYMFSMDGKVEKGLFKGVDDFYLEEIPQKIIDIYKQLVKMNIPVKAETIFLDFEKAHKKIFEDQEKDEGARVLRIVLEKTLQKIAQKNGISILDDKGKEQKIALVNDQLKDAKIISKVAWEENKTYLAIGNHASHGDYDEYDLKKVENFYKHIQELHNIFGI